MLIRALGVVDMKIVNHQKIMRNRIRTATSTSSEKLEHNDRKAFTAAVQFVNKSLPVVLTVSLHREVVLSIGLLIRTKWRKGA